jgi:hypothetical protein
MKRLRAFILPALALCGLVACNLVLGTGDYHEEPGATNGGCDVDGGIDGGGCWSCVPTSDKELLNACTDGCIPFDNSRVTKLPADGVLPPLP